jgi:hypothetical protein
MSAFSNRLKTLAPDIGHGLILQEKRAGARCQVSSF